jgi:hypothetical protein
MMRFAVVTVVAAAVGIEVVLDARRREHEEPWISVVGLEPTGLEPTGLEPTGLEPTGLEPTGLEIGVDDG